MPISELPVEIFGEIMKNYSPVPLYIFRSAHGLGFQTMKEREERSQIIKDLRNFRLVSQLFNDLASPLLFSDLTFSFDGADVYFTRVISSDCIRCCEVVAALAAGTTNVFRHTSNLHISITSLFRAPMMDSPTPSYLNDLTATQELVKHKLASAIACLQGVRLVSYYHVSATDPEPVFNQVICSLGKLPLLRHFDLRLDYPSPRFTLQSLSRLQSFQASWDGLQFTNLVATEVSSLLSRSPDLSDLLLQERGSQGGQQRSTCNEIFSYHDSGSGSLPLKKLQLDGLSITPALIKSSLRHLTNLELLQIKHTHGGKGILNLGGICYLLEHNGIHLTGIATDIADDTLLLDYLASHPGFKILRFDVTARIPQAVCGEFFQRLQHEILPVQSGSLEELYVHVLRTHAVSGHSLDAQLGSVSGCEKLWKLAVSRAISREEFEHGDTSVVEQCLKTFTKLPHLKDVILFLDSTTPGYDPESKSLMGKEQMWWELAVSRFKASVKVGPEVNDSCVPFEFRVFFFDWLRSWGISKDLGI